MAYTIDKVDLRILAKLAAEGPAFLKWQHEHRACSMRQEGYLDGEMTVYSMNAGRGTCEFRTRCSITKRGRKLLAESGQHQGDPQEGKAKT